MVKSSGFKFFWGATYGWLIGGTEGLEKKWEIGRYIKATISIHSFLARRRQGKGLAGAVWRFLVGLGLWEVF